VNFLNPYNILGVTPQASKEEIRIAYQNILNKYSSTESLNIDEQNLAEDTISQANLAYDAIVNGGIYKEIRSLIDNDNITIAEGKLNILDLRESAEWNYLKGFVYLKKGWFDVGIHHIITANEIDPENQEYIKTMETLRSRANDIINYYKKQNTNNIPPPGNTNNMNSMNPCGSGGGMGNMMGGGMC
jgi:molecular chaperone DnaJ